MSGATEDTLRDPWFRLTLSTGSVEFMPDEETGASPEEAFHQRAAARFARTLPAIQGPLAEGLLRVLGALGAQVTPVRFDPELPRVGRWEREAFRAAGNRACRLSLDGMLGYDMAELELCFERLPSEESLEALEAAVARLLSEELRLPERD